ncbi:SDR family NAD(P)-dependent oxidoreductase [Actinoplanes sp. NPDC051470]|uniref:SDR family NAD(P)-dependent oxidoreductase n=1 Tax=unclassified Actinoplanes TaxID=2626549 RepID=UPI00343A81D9
MTSGPAIATGRLPGLRAGRDDRGRRDRSGDRPAAPFHRVLDRHGRLGGLVNGAGGRQSSSGFLEISDQQGGSTFAVNPHAAVRMSRAALPPLRSDGSIMRLTSEAARFRVSSISDYSAAKTAMLALSKGLAAEFRPSGVRSPVTRQVTGAEWPIAGGALRQI